MLNRAHTSAIMAGLCDVMDPKIWTGPEPDVPGSMSM